MSLRPTLLRSTTLCPLLAAALLAASAAAAADAPAPAPYEPRAAFKETDQDSNGKVDHREFYERTVEVFYHADTNKDGSLDAAELARVPHPEPMAAADATHDGKVSLDEYVRIRAVSFRDTDRNQDGVLEVDEVVAVFEAE
jgi:EF hand